MNINEPQTAMDRLRQVLAQTSGVAFAVLIGSRANQSAREGSDWDIAVLWNPADRSADSLSLKRTDLSFLRFGRHEALRRLLAQCLNVDDEKIDLIDLSSARLAMKSLVVEEGIVVYLKDDLAWAHFQTATWRELEDHYWDRAHS